MAKSDLLAMLKNSVEKLPRANAAEEAEQLDASEDIIRDLRRRLEEE